jgi:hypothetical protein
MLPQVLEDPHRSPGEEVCMARAIVRVGQMSLALLLGLPASVVAQSTGTIAGMVRDASGAALRGVVVEAASPALIEKVRNAVTDGQGQYKIVDLRPGVYTVGSAGESWTTMSIHGSSRLAMPLLFDGMSYTPLSETGGGYRTEFVINTGAVQEMSVTVGGMSAESDVSGVTVNSIPKSGSNRCSATTRLTACSRTTSPPTCGPAA